MKKRKNEVKVIWDEPNRQRHLEKHGVDFLDASLMFLKPPFHSEMRHLQVVEIVVKNFSMMGCDQGATTPSYWAGRLA